MIETVSRQPALIDQVHDRLVAAIAEGTLAPGTKLTQEIVADMLGVSRQPVSHALQLLRRRGLVVERGKRGLVVAPLDPKRLRALYQVRAVLDGLAVTLVTERSRSQDLSSPERDRITGLLQNGMQLTKDGAPISALIEADRAFHSALYELSDNQAIVETADEQWPHFIRAMGAVLTESLQPDRVWREHAEIVDLVFGGDPGLAEAAAKAHAERAGETTATKLETLTNHSTGAMEAGRTL